jgi:cell cycle checkpoint control protein RAD9A
VEEKLHIVISVKDFKTIIAHAGITNTNVTALYSHPSSPMQLTYSDEGLMSEFILMTIGESRGASATPANASRAGSKRPASRPPLEPTASSRRAAGSEMPPPPASAAPSVNRENARKLPRRSPPPAEATQEEESLFFPQADVDRRWDPVDFENDDDEQMLLWDTEGQDVNRALCVCLNSILILAFRIRQPWVLSKDCKALRLRI